MMTVQKPKQPNTSIAVYVVSIIIMAILTQISFPSVAPDTLMTRIAWSAMVGMPSGWIMAFLFHKLFISLMLRDRGNVMSLSLEERDAKNRPFTSYR